MKLSDKAREIATLAHAGQYRRDGRTPYILHPQAVVERLGEVWPEQVLAAAWLHDVLEDTKTTVEDLRAKGILESVIHAVDLMTKKPGISYEDYILNIKANNIARPVKVNDILHNLSDRPTKGQIIKYAKALLVLVQ